MTYSAIPDAMLKEEAVAFMNKFLGLPDYLTQLLGFAKLLGVVALLIPGFPRIKEWAYAGLLFDLSGATYSIIASGQLVANWAFMVLPISLGICSYIYYHKKNNAGFVISKIQFTDDLNYYQNDKIKIADVRTA